MSVIFLLKSTLSGIVIHHILVVLFGAPLLHQFEDTFVLATILSLTTFLPFAIVSAGDLQILVDLLENRPQTSAQLYAHRIAFGSVACCIICCLFIPLDWDTWWQKYPKPCIFGATVGAFFGALFARLQIYFALWTQKRKPKKSEKSV